MLKEIYFPKPQVCICFFSGLTTGYKTECLDDEHYSLTTFTYTSNHRTERDYSYRTRIRN